MYLDEEYHSHSNEYDDGSDHHHPLSVDPGFQVLTQTQTRHSLQAGPSTNTAPNLWNSLPLGLKDSSPKQASEKGPEEPPLPRLRNSVVSQTRQTPSPVSPVHRMTSSICPFYSFCYIYISWNISSFFTALSILLQH